ncbi:mce related family protein [Mycobacterium xenopi 4042]|uniref:Mce related family protein n=1 Tax=Mycobacterium xenopi 4042 TaxID=1299334 RepID=X7ZXS7_MYCXE|nr:mce related family protein [Mycobacterium xenopi 4042]
MNDRLTRIQLVVFAVVTVVTVTLIAVFYLRLPATLGLGTYSVTADFAAGGGLYKNANVTYRGVAVGRVESVRLNHNGVDAVMRLNSETRSRRTLPRASEAFLPSVSSTSTSSRPMTRQRPSCTTGLALHAVILGSARTLPPCCASPRHWSTVWPTRGCGNCCTKLSPRSTALVPNWPGSSSPHGCWSTKPMPTIRRPRS